MQPIRAVRACRDPKDDKVLEIAVAGQADVIVTSDDDLLVLHSFEEIPIVGPAEFLSLLPSESANQRISEGGDS